MFGRHLIFVGAALAAVAPITAQQAVNLTGTPLSALTESFTRISGVRELPGNKAVVADPQDQRIMLVDFTTKKVMPIGRKGGGPGEYQDVMTAIAGPANVTWVPDRMSVKVHVVSPDGKITSTLLPPGTETGAFILPRAADAQGRLYFQGPPLRNGNVPIDTVPVLRWDTHGKTMDTVAYVPSGLKTQVSGSPGQTQMIVRPKPFPSADVWAPFPDGRIAIVHASPYRVDVIAGKSVQRGAPQPYAPIKVTAADRDAFRKTLSAARPIIRTVGGNGPPPGAPPAITVEDSDFPETKPPFSGTNAVQVSPEGEVWVARTRASNDKIPTYDIFDGTGKLIGKATLKPGSAVVGFGAGSVYVARTSEDDDLVYLEKYARSPVSH